MRNFFEKTSSVKIGALPVPVLFLFMRSLIKYISLNFLSKDLKRYIIITIPLKSLSIEKDT